MGIKRGISGLQKNCSGLSTVEWLVAACVTIMLLTMTIEASHWFLLKQHLILHTQRAVHHASLTGGKPSAIHQHLRKHLRPALLRVSRVCVLDRVDLLMRDFKDSTLSHRHSRPLIRHNHIRAQHRRIQSSGRLDATGRSSGKTISQANELNAQVTALYRIATPWLRAIAGPDLILRVTTKAVMQSPRELINNPCVHA